MTTLFILVGESGEYSERDTWVVAAYTSEQAAQAAAEEATRYSAEQTALRDDHQARIINPWWQTFWVKQKEIKAEYAHDHARFLARFPDAARFEASGRIAYDHELAATAPQPYEGPPHPVYGLSYEASYSVEEVPLVEDVS